MFSCDTLEEMLVISLNFTRVNGYSLNYVRNYDVVKLPLVKMYCNDKDKKWKEDEMVLRK